MNYFKTAIVAFAIAATAPLAAIAAGEHKDEHHAEAKASVPMAEGEVRKIDRDAGKITIKHGEVKSIDMPPMTMVFQVKDATLFDKVKAGDKIRFAAEKTPTGFGVTAIEVVK